MIDTVTYPVYIAIDKYPYCKVVNVNCLDYNIKTPTGYRKQFVGIADNLSFAHKGIRVLDVSEFSPNYKGVLLNKHHIKTRASTSKVGILESVYWASMQSRDRAGHIVTKAYEKLITMAPDMARDLFFKNAHGLINVPVYDDVEFPSPAFHPSLFHDYLYCLALMNNYVFQDIVRNGYTAFTDFSGEFINSSARAVATAVGLTKAGLFNGRILFADTFFRIFRVALNQPMCVVNNIYYTSWDNTPKLKRDSYGKYYWDTGCKPIKSSYDRDGIDYDFKQLYGWISPNPLSRDWIDIDLLLPDKTLRTAPYFDSIYTIRSPQNGNIVYLRCALGYNGCIDIDWSLLSEEAQLEYSKMSYNFFFETFVSGFGEIIYLTKEEGIDGSICPKITRANYSCYVKLIDYVNSIAKRYVQGYR